MGVCVISILKLRATISFTRGFKAQLLYIKLTLCKSFVFPGLTQR
jgi:hypothetical protein